MKEIENILASRYASAAIKEIWSPKMRIIMERELWIALLVAQKELGLTVDEKVIEAYRSVKETVDLPSIAARERINRHDVKARIEEFCDLAGYEQIHKGLTSRDLTENVVQLQIYRSLIVIRSKTVTVLDRLEKRSSQYRDTLITARTHNVAAQPTTFGKRLAMFGSEMIIALKALDSFIESYPFRGIKGAVGTQLDQLTLFDGDFQKVAKLEEQILSHLGVEESLDAVGQVYPRSLDYQTVSLLFQLASAPSSLAKTLRIMAGNETASEGFSAGQVGSSAMPHKMNSRSCERINGFHSILRGYLTMVSSLSGDQWNEGDVSCSVVRRVALPDSFYCIDGLLETLLTVLDQMTIFEAIIEKENKYYLPFLTTTTVLMEAVKRGAGREEAHEAIKEAAVATVLDLKMGRIENNNLPERLANDSRLGLSLEEIKTIINKGDQLSGAAGAQVDLFSASVETWKNRFPSAAAYKAGAIL